MGKRGPKPKGKVKIVWSPEFAYAIGLLVTDGCLSPSGRHIILTSVDRDMLENFMHSLGIKVKIGKVFSGYKGKSALRVQFGDVLFYQFLLSIGLTPNKSRTISIVKVPSRYFFDFLRGCFDGDGCTYSYFDPRWKSSFMFYTAFVSASEAHITWLRSEVFRRLKIMGHVTGGGETVFQLKYAKADSLKLLRKMFYSPNVLSLRRKRLKIEKMLSIVDKRL